MIFLMILNMLSIYIFAHSDGRHSHHSFPSDSGSYICGDKGYCSECPDNEYFLMENQYTNNKRKYWF